MKDMGGERMGGEIFFLKHWINKRRKIPLVHVDETKILSPSSAVREKKISKLFKNEGFIGS